MGIRIGHASISEKGTVNGAKGDSTGKEVCIRSWYDKSWDFVAIFPDATVRDKHASAVEAACVNDNIGYGQNDRNTLNTQAALVEYALSKIKAKCNCDCSTLQNVAAVASGSGATYGSNGWTTATMKAELKKLGYKIVTDKKYLASADYCVRGAIYVKAGSHTVCGLDNGTKASDMLTAAGIATKAAASGSNTGTKKLTKLQSAQKRNNSIKGSYKTTASTDMLYGANSDKYAKVVTLPAGTKVVNYGYYNTTVGTDWYYVVATISGKEHTGYVNSDKLKKA